LRPGTPGLLINARIAIEINRRIAGRYISGLAAVFARLGIDLLVGWQDIFALPWQNRVVALARQFLERTATREQ
jgi:hypothetical protein